MTGEQGCTWLSEGLETYLAEKDKEASRDDEIDFDVIVVGSGYGAAVAAAHLAGASYRDGTALRVTVLERGREYLPGMFPNSLSNLAGHARMTVPWKDRVVGTRDGLFDIRVHADINAVVANGLGGGSLINAGVMEVPRDSVFDERWPEPLRGGGALRDHYRAMRVELGAADRPPTERGTQKPGQNGGEVRGQDLDDDTGNVISRHPALRTRPLDKTRALETLGGKHFREAAITVAMKDGPNHSGVQMNACKLCGDCATGCNFGAKESLDLNLLVRARRRGVRMITGASVLSVARRGDAWALQVTCTDPNLAGRQGAPVELRARKVVLAAGSFGSTEILLRSADSGLSLSAKLGGRFSGNGDMIAVGYGHDAPVNAVANESDAYHERRIGPTITGVIDLRDRHPRYPMVIEEMAVPGPMRRIFEELYTSVACLQGLVEADHTRHADGNPARDPLAVDPDTIRHSAIYAVIGDDGGKGKLRLRQGFETHSEGAIDVDWKDLPDHGLFPAQVAELERLYKDAQSGGRVIGNPLWNPLPRTMDFMLGGKRGPLTTVHPLGGCGMADDASLGVVDHLGRVFSGPRGKDVHEGLVVLDGAVIPGALGTNPALTIAAVADRAMQHLVPLWGLDPAQEGTPEALTRRPVYREMPPAEPVTPTTMQFAERLQGPVTLALDGEPRRYQAEITLFFEDKALPELVAVGDDSSGTRHTLRVASHRGIPNTVSQVRLFRREDWLHTVENYPWGQARETRLDELCLLSAPLTGTLTIMGRRGSGPLRRTARAAWAWLLHRGLRDTWQSCFPLVHENPQKPGIRRTLQLGLQWASHAGEMRLFDYRLKIGEGNTRGVLEGRCFAGRALLGTKEIVYRRGGNPLLQMSEMELTAFPGLRRGWLDQLGLVPWRRRQVLRLVPEFLARNGLPLFRLVRQHDMPQAMADLASLALYFTRLLASIHIPTFRAPDRPPPREPNRLPQKLPGLPAPDRHYIAIDEVPGEARDHRGECLLSRYRGRREDSPAVLCIHGYSASGTTFAHPALKRDLARHLWEAGWDVWILDMRSSCGMQATATRNFSFEELAGADIPLAVERVCARTGHASIDVVAHCMGAAMLSMAVLAAHRVPAGAPYEHARRELPGRIRRAVLSQVGPLVSMAPGNVFRAYLFSYLKHLLPLDRYSFQSRGTLLDDLLDRVLAVIPYSDEEFDLENPRVPWRRSQWVTTRHRMDLLYGVTFALGNLDAATLAHIDDFFGPLSVDTATQVAHFAKYQTITDHAGNNDYVSRATLRRNWHFPTLSIHGSDNGLADVRTVERMATILRDAGCDHRRKVFPGYGHQDCLIGARASEVFESVRLFLAEEERELPGRGSGARELVIQVPWSGPVMGPVQKRGAGEYLPVSFGVNPALSDPLMLVAMPLTVTAGKLDVLAAGGGASCQVLTALQPRDGWVKTLLPLADESVHGLLLLLVYDEHPSLDNALFGKAEEHIDFPSFERIDAEPFSDGAVRRVLADLPGESPETVRAAIAEFVRKRGERIMAGTVRVPRWRDDGSLVLGLGSCQYPPGILDEKPGFRSYRRLAQRLGQPGAPHQPDLLLLMGDQVYVDPTAGLADPTARDERYVHPYQRWYRSRSVRQVLRRVPVCTMLDDHEIEDNWEPTGSADGDRERALRLGIDHYNLFQKGAHQDEDDRLWYELEARGFDVFVADTRTRREHRRARGSPVESILGEEQERALEAWLRRVAARADPARPKFLVSPAMLAPRQRVVLPEKGAGYLRSDGWEGYPASQARLLAWVAGYSVENLVCVSGDAHLSCVAELHLRGEKSCHTLYAVHASALYAPYPFANSQREHYLPRECFTVNADLRCEVRTRFAQPGDGFAYLSVSREDAGWRVAVSFDRQAGVSGPVELLRTPPRCGC